MEKTGLPADKIGIVFISPCPSKMSAVKSPLGIEKSDIDAVCAIKDAYVELLPKMKEVLEPEELTISGKMGISWGATGGEAGSLLSDNYLAADGIENVIRVLEDLEDQKFASNLEFIELNACSGGCVGGVLTVENPYVAKVKMKHLRKYLPVACNHIANTGMPENAYWTQDVEYEPVFRLGGDRRESIAKMAKVEELCKKFPGLDCGSCGAPTCKALAEDIVRGEAREHDCIHILKEFIHRLSGEVSRLSGE